MMRDIVVGAIGIAADLIAAKRRRTKEWLAGTGPAPQPEPSRPVRQPRHQADEVSDA